MRIELAKDVDTLERIILRALLDRVSAVFPYVYGNADCTTVNVIL
jgi:hypothetical protein